MLCTLYSEINKLVAASLVFSSLIVSYVYQQTIVDTFKSDYSMSKIKILLYLVSYIQLECLTKFKVWFGIKYV